MIKEDIFVKGHHNRFLQTIQDFIAVCPKCESVRISSRQRKKLKYKCRHCGKEFDNPKAKIVHKTKKQKGDFGRQYSNPDE